MPSKCMPGMHRMSLTIQLVCCQGQLMHIHKTLDSMKRRSAQRSAHQQQTEQGQLVAAATDTISLRAKVNARCVCVLCAYGHMLYVALLTIAYIFIESVLLVFVLYLFLRLGSLKLDICQIRCRHRNRFVMMCAVSPAKWSSLQPSRVRGAGQAQLTLLLNLEIG